MQRVLVRLQRGVLPLLILAVPCFAVLPPGTVWEVRPSVGSDTNGGGFVTGSSGTDWSVFNAAQYTLSNGVTNGTTTIATISAVADMVGNIAYVQGGTGSVAANWYQVVSQITGTSITVDRSTGLTAGTGVTINIGGALATVATANTHATANNIIYCKATGTYLVTSAVSISLNSGAAPGTPYSIIGYTTTRGDNGLFTWTTSTNSIDLIDLANAVNLLIQNINFTTTAGTPADGIQAFATGESESVYVINCKFTNFLHGIEAEYNVNSAISPLYLMNSRITGSTSDGIRNTGSTYMLGDMIDNNAGIGAVWTQGNAPSLPWTINASIFYNNTGSGFSAVQADAASWTVIENSIFSSNGAAGVLTGNAVFPSIMFNNNIFDKNGTYGIDAGTGTHALQYLWYNNAFYSNTSGTVRNITGGIGTISLSVSPYVSLGTNFALNNTTGGGAALKAAGFPGVIPNGGTGYMSVGALQPASATGGGSHGYPIVQ